MFTSFLVALNKTLNPLSSGNNTVPYSVSETTPCFKQVHCKTVVMQACFKTFEGPSFYNME